MTRDRLSSTIPFSRLVRLGTIAAALGASVSGQTPPPGSWGPPVQHDLDVDNNQVIDFSIVPRLGHRTDNPAFSGCGTAPCANPLAQPEAEKCTRFKAVHMALIPKGPHAGRVLVWDERASCTSTTIWFQRWAILDCSGAWPVVVHNGELQNIQLQDGDLFCSGHA